jgi:hypothetical protein
VTTEDWKFVVQVFGSLGIGAAGRRRNFEKIKISDSIMVTLEEIGVYSLVQTDALAKLLSKRASSRRTSSWQNG